MVLKIKFYDKVMETVGRDGYKQVGSKCSRIVGATRVLDDLNLKFRRAKMAGLTRIEVSFLFDDSY